MTEFLPVSSSGHLVLFQKILGIENHSLEFDVAAHLGTLASVLTLYFQFIKKTVGSTLKRPFVIGDSNRLLFRAVVAASIPTGIIGLVFKDTFESMFSNLSSVGICLCLTGVILMITKFVGNKSADEENQSFTSFQQNDLSSLTLKIAIVIGFVQALAIAPGISRSGITIAAGVILGLPHRISALFSFMIAIPAILGAGVLQLRGLSVYDTDVVLSLLLGFVVAYVSGLVGLWMILQFVKKGRLHLFSYYLWAVGAYTIFWAARQ